MKPSTCVQTKVLPVKHTKYSSTVWFCEPVILVRFVIKCNIHLVPLDVLLLSVSTFCRRNLVLITGGTGEALHPQSTIRYSSPCNDGPGECLGFVFH